MSEIEKRTEVFEKMPIHKAVIKQLLPSIASQMVALIYNLADTYFVGKLNDPDQTAAIAVTASSFLMLTAISNLFGVGGASMVAQALGKHDKERAKQISCIAFYGGLISSLIFAAVFYFFAKPILRLCGASGGVTGYALGYAKWTVVYGASGTILNILLANLVRAEGSAAAASIGVSIGGIMNIVLDPLFVLPEFAGLGAVGAGAATAISNFIGAMVFMAYIIINRKHSFIKLNPKRLKNGFGSLKRILAIGFPSALQYALTVVAVAAQSRFVSQYDNCAVAALGIVKKLDQLPLYFSIGTANGMLPMLAYNYAAKNYKRQRQAFRFGCMISLGMAVICLIAYEIFAPTLVSLFIKDALTRRYGAAFLRCMVTAMPMMSICYPMIIQFQAMGKVRESLICSILRKGVLDIPLLFAMDAVWPLYGCMLVQPIVDAVSLVTAVCFYKRINAQLKLEEREYSLKC